jgi:hypothetical protein
VVDSLIEETAEGVGLDSVPGLEEIARPVA